MHKQEIYFCLRGYMTEKGDTLTIIQGKKLNSLFLMWNRVNK